MNRAPDQPRQRRQRRVVFVAVVALAIFGSFATRPPEPAAASATDESAFVVALNDVRAGVGLPALTVNSQLADLARGHAVVMSEAGEIFHADPISAGYSGPWSKLGENVGVGANVAVLVDAFVASPGHYANIVDPSFTEIGVGVVWKDNALYTTHRFLQLPGAPSTTTQPPPVATTAAPTTTRPEAPPTTTSTVAPFAPPAISAERVITLIELLERIGT